jgi:hypothetical protein
VRSRVNSVINDDEECRRFCGDFLLRLVCADIALLYFVASATLWRDPRKDSLLPFVYTLAVSMKLHC